MTCSRRSGALLWISRSRSSAPRWPRLLRARAALQHVLACVSLSSRVSEGTALPSVPVGQDAWQAALPTAKAAALRTQLSGSDRHSSSLSSQPGWLCSAGEELWRSRLPSKLQVLARIKCCLWLSR